MFDQLVLFVIGFFTVIALFRGFIRELLGILGLAVAVVGTYMATPYVAAMLIYKIPSYLVAQSIAGLVTLIFMFIATSILCNLLSSSLSKIRHGFLDTILGGLLGCVKGLAICFIMYALALSALPILNPEVDVGDEIVAPEWLSRSHAYPIFLGIGRYLESTVLVDYETHAFTLGKKVADKRDDDGVTMAATTEDHLDDVSN